MSIHIDQVLDYLGTHPICRQAENIPSLLEMLLMAEVDRIP